MTNIKNYRFSIGGVEVLLMPYHTRNVYIQISQFDTKYTATIEDIPLEEFVWGVDMLEESLTANGRAASLSIAIYWHKDNTLTIQYESARIVIDANRGTAEQMLENLRYFYEKAKETRDAKTSESAS